MAKPWYLPLSVSGFLLLSQAFPLPSVVRDAATGLWVNGFSFHLPPLYVVFAPFCGVADRLTLLSFHQAMVFLVYVFAAFCVLRDIRKILIGFVLFLAFLVWGGAVPHPMARLVADNPDTLLIDFHSHSQSSHDGRSSFTAEANMRWHRLQGYGASFITDHNRSETSQKGKILSREDWKQTGYRSLEGEEVSLWKTHLVILGNHERFDNQPYDSDPKKVGLFIAEMNRRKWPVIASLPEYWRYHWQGSPWGTIDDFVSWGINGFEIFNSAPKALDFPPALRHQIVDLCKRKNLFMTGISDNHGFGYATAVWNAMQIPGWKDLDPDALEKAVISALQTHKFKANQVLERARYNPRTPLGLVLAPGINAVMYWRSLQMMEVLSWILWSWILLWGIPCLYRKQRAVA